MITQERLVELLDYNSETGLFTRKVATQGVKVGDVAGTLTSYGYIDISVGGRKYKAHRLAWLYTYGVWPKYDIDHIDNNKTNNAIGNLQDVPDSVNLARRKAYGVTKLKGVYRHRNKFQAKLRIDGRDKHLGTFENPVDAHLAWGVEARKLFGDQFFCDCAIHKEAM